MIKEMFCIFWGGWGKGEGVSRVFFPPQGSSKIQGKKGKKKNGEKKPRKGRKKKEEDLTKKGQSALKTRSGDSGRDLRRKPPDLGNAEK